MVTRHKVTAKNKRPLRRLYHHSLSTRSRAVRIALVEKLLDFDLFLEKPWERRDEFLELDPAADVPILIEEDGAIITSPAILDYIDEAYPDVPLYGNNLLDRAEVRRLVGWFDQKFYSEVTVNLVGEKAWKRLSRAGQPNPHAIRMGLENIRYHLDYVGWLADQRLWLAGDRISAADIMAAAHISTVDFLGDVPWNNHPEAKDWYARIKSRPSMRQILSDSVPGIVPPSHYADVDF